MLFLVCPPNVCPETGIVVEVHCALLEERKEYPQEIGKCQGENEKSLRKKPMKLCTNTWAYLSSMHMQECDPN